MRPNSYRRLAGEVKPSTTTPYFDRVCAWLREPLSPQRLAKLRSDCRHLHAGNRPAGFSMEYRQRLDMKQPTDAALAYLAKAAPDALVNQAEFAIDFAFASRADRERAWEFLDKHLARAWHRPSQPVRLVGGETRYDAPRSARNLWTAYREAHSRVTGEFDVIHLEWRAKGKRAAESAGIHSTKALLDFDFHAFWNHRLRWLEIEPERLGRLVRNSASASKSRTPVYKEYKCGRYRRTVNVDERLGLALLNPLMTENGMVRVQEAIDRYASKFRISRIATKLDIVEWLPEA